MPLITPGGGGGSGGGGSGTVTSISSGDTSIVVANPTTTPVLQIATLDVIATNRPAAADWSNNSHKITSLLDPASAQDAATKNYVDTQLNGLNWKAACRLATAAALPTNAYLNGASGVGATLTGTAFGALSIDGVAVVVGDRVLVKNEVAGANNGIYTVTAVGNVAAFYVLTRATDYNQASELAAGDAVYALLGTANTDTSWVLTTTGAITIGTTALTFTQFGGNLVSSVFTRTGAVVAVSGDYNLNQIGNATDDYSLNSHKITNLTNGSGAQDAAAFGQLSGLGYGLSIFGDGSDGSVTFDGSTTILGMAPSSNVYTLTRDFFFSAVTLNSGVQIKTNGFRIFCAGTFTGGSSTAIIQWNGAPGVVTAAGAATNNNTNSSINSGAGGASPGTTGGAGGTAAGTAATNSTNANLGGVGGVGGTGNGGANAGGAGGTATAMTAVMGTIRSAPSAILTRAFGGGTTAASFSQLSGGTGGGGGGGDGTAGGGGGAGGGVVAVFARTFAGTGAIQARGGGGGTPAGGNRGGGGGGGGGWVIVVSQSVVAGAVSGWTIDAALGAAGVSTGNGGTPGAANAGIVILLPA